MMFQRYAQGTEVSSERSRSEIERILVRYGATGFMYGWSEKSNGTVKGSAAVIAFHAQGRRVQFVLPMPDKADKKFTLTPAGRRRRDSDAALAAWEQETRQRWRALLLVIKAKLEAVASGITTFESEFLAHIVLPNGETVGGWIGPQIKDAYETGSMPPLLPSHGAERP